MSSRLRQSQYWTPIVIQRSRPWRPQVGPGHARTDDDPAGSEPELEPDIVSDTLVDGRRFRYPFYCRYGYSLFDKTICAKALEIALKL